MGDELHWECAASRAPAGFAGETPPDCDWPYCGCDPKASEVLDALAKQGYSPDDSRELAKLRSGEELVLPVSRKHAEAMHLVAEAFLKKDKPWQFPSE